MTPIPPDEPEDDSCDPVALPIAASELEVDRHERLAYPDIPVRKPKSRPAVSSRLKRFFDAVYYWVHSRC